MKRAIQKTKTAIQDFVHCFVTEEDGKTVLTPMIFLVVAVVTVAVIIGIYIAFQH